MMKEIKTLKEIKEEQTKPKKEGKLKRWHYIAMSLVVLLLGVGLVLNVLVNKLQAKAAKTPIMLEPSLSDKVDTESSNKTDQYEDEIRTQKRRTQEEKEEDQRIDRIRMAWDKVYKDGRLVDNPKDTIVKSEAERKVKFKKTQPRSRSGRKSKEVLLKEPKKSLLSQSSGFNLRKEKQKLTSSSKDKNISELEVEASFVFVHAVISGDQKVSSGQSVKLRLIEDIQFGNIFLPKNTSLNGKCSITTGRVRITLNQVLIGTEIHQVNFICHDQDLNEGIAYHNPKVEKRLRRRASNEVGNELSRAVRNIPYAGGVLSPIVREVENVTGGGRAIQVSLQDNYRILLKVN